MLRPNVYNSFEMAIENLEDFSMDVPKAPQYLIGMFKKLISEEVLSMEQVSDLIKKTDLIHSLDIVGQVKLQIHRRELNFFFLHQHVCPYVFFEVLICFVTSTFYYMVLSLSRCLLVQDTDKHGPSNIQHLKGNDPVSEIEKWLEVS